MAARLAVAIENSFGVKPALVAGADGIFDVTVDGQMVFSKYETGDLIETGDIVELIREHVRKRSFHGVTAG